MRERDRSSSSQGTIYHGMSCPRRHLQHWLVQLRCLLFRELKLDVPQAPACCQFPNVVLASCRCFRCCCKVSQLSKAGEKWQRSAAARVCVPSWLWVYVATLLPLTDPVQKTSCSAPTHIWTASVVIFLLELYIEITAQCLHNRWETQNHTALLLCFFCLFSFLNISTQH